jgi:hypothetical protein
MGQRERRVRQDAQTAKVDIDVLEVNILGLSLVGLWILERIDLEEQLLVRFLSLVGVEQLGRLVRRLATPFLNLLRQLGLGLLERFQVDLSITSFDLRTSEPIPGEGRNARDGTSILRLEGVGQRKGP